MRRRNFITLLGGVAAMPLAARAQQPGTIPRLGILLYSDPQTDPTIEAFRRAFSGLGYTDGQNVSLVYRFAERKSERLPGLAAELVALAPDVLLAMGGDVTPFVTKATPSIPIVFVMSTDPVQLGTVASLARPGGNATGFTFLHDELATKRMALLKEAAPRVSRVAMLWNPAHLDNEHREAQRAASTLGVQLLPFEVRGAGDLDGAFQAATQAGADALYVVSSRQTSSNTERIVEFATKNRLPLAGGWGGWAKAGGLLSYGANPGTISALAAGYVDKILKGAKPADLPVQQPTRFELTINGKTAAALGLTLPPALLAFADEVIE
jgi:putative tryptophan/tyrosine transport system substrate-binding protein